MATCPLLRQKLVLFRCFVISDERKVKRTKGAYSDLTFIHYIIIVFQRCGWTIAVDFAAHEVQNAVGWSFSARPDRRICNLQILFSVGQRRDFSFFITSRPALGPIHPAIQWLPGPLSPEIKRSGREADHSHPSSAEVENAWSCTSSRHGI